MLWCRTKRVKEVVGVNFYVVEGQQGIMMTKSCATDHCLVVKCILQITVEEQNADWAQCYYFSWSMPNLIDSLVAN